MYFRSRKEIIWFIKAEKLYALADRDKGICRMLSSFFFFLFIAMQYLLWI